MVLKKCVKCKKNITKKVPGLECSRCNAIVHADPACSKLSNKQLNTLRNSSGIEWSCEECSKNISRRSSFVIPDDDGDEDDCESITGATQVIDGKKLAQDISREIKKTFRDEIRNLESSMEFLSEQLTNIEQSIKKQDSKIKELENKNHDLINKNKNLELRVCALEQGYIDSEQKSLTNSFEIAGLPEIQSSEIGPMVESIATKLNVDTKEVQSSRRLPGTRDKPGPILVAVKSKTTQGQWIAAGKEKCLTVGQLVPDAPKEQADSRVYIREALTKYHKTLLFNAKAKLLNKLCQFVWCKNGKVYARKTGNSKIFYIRTINDIDQIEKQCVPQIEKAPKASSSILCN